MDDAVLIQGDLIKLTEKAALVQLDEDWDNQQVWFPLSQIDTAEDLEEGFECEFYVPRWLAEEKDLA
jgi:hypothetical protein